VDVPVTCKLRIGASPRSLNVLSLSQKLAKAGACAITIHGRSGEKKFGTPIDLGLIQDVTRALSVPVVANGGIFSGVDALHALQKTGAAAVMPGRGLIGNPWIIQEIIKAFSKDPFMPPSLKEKKDVCLEHLGLLCDFYGERTGVLRMRKILPEYFSSCEFLKELKQDVQRGNYACDIPPLLERIRELDGRVVYDTRTA